MDERVAQLIDKVNEVCPIPATTQRVLALLAQEDVELVDVSAAIALDPAMAVELLRIANSAAFGRSRHVDEIHQAVLLVGTRELRQMAAAMAMLAAFRSTEEIALDFHGSSALCGAIAAGLAVLTHSCERGPAFVAGLLHEIGAMACLAVDGPGYSALWKESVGSWETWSPQAWEQRCRLEVERYGATTALIGARLLRRNLLPDDVADAVELQYHVNFTAEPALGRVVCFARFATPVLIRAVMTQQRELLTDALPTLAEATGFGHASPAALLALCFDAGHRTEVSLRALAAS